MSDLPFSPEAMLTVCMSMGRATARRGNQPIAAIAVGEDGVILSSACDDQYETGVVLRHAVMNLLHSLIDADEDVASAWIVVNGEPCTMCAGALLAARPAGVMYGVAGSPPSARSLFDQAHDAPTLIGPVDEDRWSTPLRTARAVAQAFRENE